MIAKFSQKSNLMQNSAFSFSVCMVKDVKKVSGFMKDIANQFRMKYKDQLESNIIRYHNQEFIEAVIENKQILSQENGRYTAQFVVRSDC